MRVYKALAVLLLAAFLGGCGGGDGAGTTEPNAAEAAETNGAETAEPSEAEVAEADAAEAETLDRNGVIIPKSCPDADRPAGAMNVALDGWETPETAGILMASQRGYFADLGLEVTTLATVGPGSVIPAVLVGNDEIGVSHQPEVLLAREEGAPIAILRSLIPQPTAAMIWLKQSKIRDIADLSGKTIAFPGLSFQKIFLEKILERGGLTLEDVKLERAGNELVPELASGRVDAIFGRWNLQGAELEARGLEPVITRVQDLGIPDYDEIVFVARADCLAKKRQLYRDFMSAFSRGIDAAVKSPSSAAEALRADYESNPETDRKAAKAQFEATLPLLSRSGYVSPDKARRLAEWMHEEAMIKRQPPPAKLLTNAYR